MPNPNWLEVLDFQQALVNVSREYHGDWHKDPWAWPEYSFLLGAGQDLIKDRLNDSGCQTVSLISVPKENWGVRPAVVLDVLDRICYQGLVDYYSVKFIGDLSRSVYGWRLLPANPKAGHYAKDSMQWDNYRGHIEAAGNWFDAALRTDVVSCFASMNPEVVLDEVSTKVGKSALVDRLASFLQGFDRLAARSGLPQRARPSSVLANMILRHFDDVMHDYAEEIPSIRILGKQPTASRLSYVRWMDDMWLFGADASFMRKAQLELQSVAQDIGLHLNSSKTEVLEGPDVLTVAMEVELSAVDSGLKDGDAHPLQELIERVLESPETAGRTQVKFMIRRMIDSNIHYRDQELFQAAKRMPHCSDALAEYFRGRFVSEGLQEWFLSEIADDWNLLQWPRAQYLGMFGSEHVPLPTIRGYCENVLNDLNTELPVLALAAQRLAAWDPAKARSALSASVAPRTNPHERRVVAVAALAAGESKFMVKKWLKQEDANAPTLQMLEKENFHPVKVNPQYATAGPAGA